MRQPSRGSESNLSGSSSSIHVSDAAATGVVRNESATGGMKSAIATTCDSVACPVSRMPSSITLLASVAPDHGGAPTTQRALKCCVKLGVTPGIHGSSLALDG